jgi:hypothetical protein
MSVSVKIFLSTVSDEFRLYRDQLRKQTHQKIAAHTNKVREIGGQIRRICNYDAGAM